MSMLIEGKLVKCFSYGTLLLISCLIWQVKLLLGHSLYTNKNASKIFGQVPQWSLFTQTFNHSFIKLSLSPCYEPEIVLGIESLSLGNS